MLPTLPENDATEIDNPERFFLALGNLHDADVKLLKWDTARARFEINIDDLYSNYFQTPQYPGKLSVRLIAVGLIDLKIDSLQGKYPLRVLTFNVSKLSAEPILSVAIIFGEGKIEFNCKAICMESEESPRHPL